MNRFPGNVLSSDRRSNSKIKVNINIKLCIVIHYSHTVCNGGNLENILNSVRQVNKLILFTNYNANNPGYNH